MHSSRGAGGGAQHGPDAARLEEAPTRNVLLPLLVYASSGSYAPRHVPRACKSSGACGAVRSSHVPLEHVSSNRVLRGCPSRRTLSRKLQRSVEIFSLAEKAQDFDRTQRNERNVSSASVPVSCLCVRRSRGSRVCPLALQSGPRCLLALLSPTSRALARLRPRWMLTSSDHSCSSCLDDSCS